MMMMMRTGIPMMATVRFDSVWQKSDASKMADTGLQGSGGV
jgi:hypothetical protein